jgi:hypothetical protein
MADQLLADHHPPNPNFTTDDSDGLAIPPLDQSFFDQDLPLADNFEDFDFNFDDYLSFDNENINNSSPIGSEQVIISSDPESGCSNQANSETEVHAVGNLDVAEYLNVTSSNSPEISGPASSQGSGNVHSGGSEAQSYPSPDSGNNSRSTDSSHNSANVLDKDVVKLEELGKNSVSKRKKETDDVISELRTSKFRRSNAVENADESVLNSSNDDEEKKKARLMRNRESAQLSRQRKKHYVEELEDKVRAMHSTIQDLNAKISFIVAENTTLKHQLSSGGGAGCPPPPPVMYPHPHMAPMGYPWMTCPPYVVKSQGSQVPLVPIPRLKPQKSATKTKTKKVASVSLLGLMFCMLLFTGLFPGKSDVTGDKRGRVLIMNDHVSGTNHSHNHNHNHNVGLGYEKFGNAKDHKDSSKHNNDSEPLVASLYVPRNDKLVKIDGNLIIHSVLASEKAMKKSKETGSAVALPQPISVPNVGLNGRKPHSSYRALPSGSAAGEDNLESPVGDGKLQQWFREGLAGPLLSSGMCTEVFQFDVSPAPGSIIPASPVHNITSQDRRKNTTNLNRVKNRRILHGLPIPLPSRSHNFTTTKQAGPTSQDDSPNRNNSSLSSTSSMVVSVLFDPREAGDSDGVMGPPKSLTRIFVVVLLDSVKYVTYSCVLPLMGSSSHLVTT